jgi:hypothetical protein
MAFVLLVKSRFGPERETIRFLSCDSLCERNFADRRSAFEDFKRPRVSASNTLFTFLGHDLHAQRLQSVVRVAPRTAVKEISFKHYLDNARYRSLQQPIRDRIPTMGAFRFCVALWVFQPAGPLVRDRRRLEAVRKSLRPAASTRPQTARCSPPSIPLAARRFIIPHVSVRNSGVSKCANEVNRTVRCSLAFFAI